MLQYLRRFFTDKIGMKCIALILALALWFYVVGELNKGSEEEKRFLNTLLPREEAIAKKLTIKPIFVGKLRQGYTIEGAKIVVVPEYCIVVGTRELLNKIKFAYTLPIDVNGASKSFMKPVPLNPIAPGIYMEETLVEVTVPITREN
ncbi:MAG: YbbR-like domain-containing protein [Candidatus Omnitrophota bacterium]|nr:YbbR-like domain-containing protein [Candidatus Omnitrophota bacterium]